MGFAHVPDICGVRQCHLKTVADFRGYGFSLRTDGNSGNQLVENVEHRSPAESCGLLNGDIILKINGKPVAGLLHSEAVQLIKTNSNEVLLLVVQPVTWAKYQKHEDPVTAAEAEALICRTPSPMHKDSGMAAGFSTLTPAEKQLLIGDTVTMNIVQAKRRNLLPMLDGARLQPAIDDHCRIASK